MTHACAAAPATMLAVAAMIAMGCMKENTPQIARLVDHIETVEQWSRSPARSEHVAWLERAVAWDIVAVVTMTWAARDVDDPERIDELLRSGLREVAAGPGEHVPSLVHDWRRTLGAGACRSGPATSEDVRWMEERLTLPAPKGASAESLQALAGYAKRASEARDIVRIDCGGPARLLVAKLADRLVVVVRP